MPRLRLIVRGKVQNVYFRAEAKKCAEKLHLTGFARNEPDGAVHLEVEGPSAGLEQFVSWCRHGPDEARVDSVASDQIAIKNTSGFNTL
jgi:acylphosphatase